MSNKLGYKTTEIGEIPEEWQVVRLNEIASSFIGGGTPSTSKPEYWDGDIPWMRSAWIKKRVVDSGERYITKKGLQNSAANIVPQGNILVATRVCIGNVAINKIDIAISQDLTGIIIETQKAYPEYVYWALRYYENKIKSLVQGSTIKGILREDLKVLKLPLSPIPEQQKIASILSCVDEVIQRTDEIILKTRELKKGLMQQLLTKGIGHTRFKQTEIGEIPEEWEVVKLEKVVTSFRNGIYKKTHFYGRGIPSVRMFNIQDGKVNIEGALSVEVSEQELLDYGLRPGDIVVNRVNTIDLVGKAGIVPENLGKATFESKNIRIRIHQDKCVPEFLTFFMNTDTYHKQIRSRIKPAIGQATINQDDLNKVNVPLPPLQEQKKIASILSAVDDKIEKERQRKDQLEKLKKGFMQDLLTGRVRVKVN